MPAIAKLQVLFFTLLSVLLQVCVCQNPCPLFPDRDRLVASMKTRITEETALEFNKTQRPPGFNDSLPRMRPSHRSLMREGERADAFARTNFERRIPFIKPICPHIRKDIIIGSWIFYKEWICYVPPPFSGYRFYNVVCSSTDRRPEMLMLRHIVLFPQTILVIDPPPECCCRPCRTLGQHCGLLFCTPSRRRYHSFPAYCWRLLPFFPRAGWEIMRFYTFGDCTCNSLLIP